MIGMPKKKLEELRKSPCWEWPYYLNAYGYAVKMKDYKPMRVHRAIFEALFKKVPPNKCLDHLCRNRKCVNPYHLEVVTNRENVLRGVGISAKNAVKTHCKRGHPLSGWNIMPHKKEIQRSCRICQYASNKRTYHLRKLSNK